MAWYQIINAKSDDFVADRDAEELVRHFSAVLQAAEPPGDMEIFYGPPRMVHAGTMCRCRPRPSKSRNGCLRPMMPRN